MKLQIALDDITREAAKVLLEKFKKMSILLKSAHHSHIITTFQLFKNSKTYILKQRFWRITRFWTVESL
jgi:hypothetical protein